MSTAPLLFDPLRRPPSPDGMRTGATLALVVHAGLIAALAYGVAWRRHDVQTLSAELWAAVPQIAAPMAPEVPPPAPTPPPKPTPAPPPPPPPKAETPSRDADIALEKARKKAQAERDAAEKLAEEKRKTDEKKLADKKLADKKAQDEKDKEKDRREAEAKARADKAEKDKVQKLADKREADAKARDEAADKARADRVKALLNKDMASGGAVGNGPANSSGTAAQSAAPSASYAGRIRAYLIPKIVYTGPRDRSMQADVEVRLAPDGTILGSRLIKSSGQPGWDAAVLQVLEKVGALPRDSDGRVQPVMVLTLDPGNS